MSRASSLCGRSQRRARGKIGHFDAVDKREGRPFSSRRDKPGR
jgi:hypothetical protein